MADPTAAAARRDHDDLVRTLSVERAEYAELKEQLVQNVVLQTSTPPEIRSRLQSDCDQLKSLEEELILGAHAKARLRATCAESMQALEQLRSAAATTPARPQPPCGGGPMPTATEPNGEAARDRTRDGAPPTTVSSTTERRGPMPPSTASPPAADAPMLTPVAARPTMAAASIATARMRVNRKFEPTATTHRTCSLSRALLTLRGRCVGWHVSQTIAGVRKEPAQNRTRSRHDRRVIHVTRSAPQS